MKLSVFVIATALQISALYAGDALAHKPGMLKKRQATTSGSSSSVPVSSPVSSSASASVSPTLPTSSTATPAPATPGTGTAPATGTPTTPPVATGPPPLATYTGVPALESLTSGAPTRVTLGPSTTYAAGVKVPVTGAPALPAFTYAPAEWPTMDRVPPVDSAEVAAWMKELDGVQIPDWSPTKDGSCGGDPVAASEAATRGWWTCGGHVRSTDVTFCPDKNTWGVSFDDGPAPYTPYLLNYLDEKDIIATFFVVGSRVIERPDMLRQEYMAGHEISVHSWSHRPLTTLTNAQVVAELGWTRKAIKEVLGVTPTTMRPPFGDIDDRVRAISLAMGMVPIMWSRTPSGGVFDTNDWMVAAGHVTGEDSFRTFQTIMNNATAMDTGFIVLQHDLYESSVDLAVGYTLPFAQGFTPKLNLRPIGQCIKKPTTDMYLESNTNKTFPAKREVDVSGDGSVDVKSGEGSGALSLGASIFSVIAACAVAVSALL